MNIETNMHTYDKARAYITDNCKFKERLNGNEEIDEKNLNTIKVDGYFSLITISDELFKKMEVLWITKYIGSLGRPIDYLSTKLSNALALRCLYITQSNAAFINLDGIVQLRKFHCTENAMESVPIGAKMFEQLANGSKQITNIKLDKWDRQGLKVLKEFCSARSEENKLVLILNDPSKHYYQIAFWKNHTHLTIVVRNRKNLNECLPDLLNDVLNEKMTVRICLFSVYDSGNEISVLWKTLLPIAPNIEDLGLINFPDVEDFLIERKDELKSFTNLKRLTISLHSVFGRRINSLETFESNILNSLELPSGFESLNLTVTGTTDAKLKDLQTFEILKFDYPKFSRLVDIKQSINPKKPAENKDDDADGILVSSESHCIMI